ncbi:hypothetical protein BIU88_02415 [Chlorobaculum limnaeum]|uniref:Flavinylation-associated cytochrome domain-containing protein n=1 Tax=Chlorobaculum limnaeum TaxID=274537 RepID=A0A1D8D2M3_CHLLM|nr:DUF4405 domain-containing protein [Chlorobaculum limnaeum]AOS83097.1 hypothetical protein BIU88_02415 [Chlorobaculum limnaeum]
MKPTLKSWATPLVIATFIISAVTGILIFFHKEGGLIKPVHEWLSWALVTGGVLHTIANWKSFANYFSRKAALAIISTGLIITIAAITVPSQGKGGNPFMRVNRTLSTASVETLAPIVKLTPEQAVAKLEQKGLKVGNANQSIKEIATSNDSEAQKVILALFE